MVWQTYEIAGVPVDVRTTSHALGEALDDVLAEYRTTEEASIELSLLIGDTSEVRGSKGKPLHTLYSGSLAIIKTPDAHRVVTAFLNELAALAYASRDDAIYASLGCVEKNGRLALVPFSISNYLLGTGRLAARRAGLEVTPSRAVAIDPATGRLIPPPRIVELAPEAVQRCAHAAGGNGNGAEPRGRRSGLGEHAPEGVGVDVVWVNGDGGETLATPASRAAAVAESLPAVYNLERLGSTALEGMIELVRQAACYEVRFPKARDIPKTLARVLDGH